MYTFLILYLCIIASSFWNQPKMPFNIIPGYSSLQLCSLVIGVLIKRLFKVTQGDWLVNSYHFQKASITFTQKRQL